MPEKVFNPDDLAELVNENCGRVKDAAQIVGISELTYAMKLRQAGYERIVRWQKIEKEVQHD